MGPHIRISPVAQVLKEKIEALRERYGYKPHSNQEYQELADGIREDMSESGVVVTREDFNGWLTSEKELISKMDDAEIDLSCNMAGLPVVRRGGLPLQSKCANPATCNGCKQLMFPSGGSRFEQSQKVVHYPKATANYTKSGICEYLYTQKRSYVYVLYTFII